MKLKNIWNKVFHYHSFNSEDPLSKSKSVIFNFLLIFISVIVLFLTLINSYYGHTKLVYIDLAVLLILILPSFILAYFKKGQIAVHIFLSGIILLAFLGVNISMNESRFTGSEYLFISLALVGLVMFERWLSLVYLLLPLGMLAFLKFKKYSIMGMLDHKNFPLEIINTAVFTLVAIFIVYAFKNTIYSILKESRNKQKMLYSLIDNLPLFIALLDGEGKYVIVNQQYEQGFQRPVDEIIGKHYKEVLPNNVLATHNDYMLQALEGKSPNFSEEVKLPDGSHTYVNGKYYPIFNDSIDVEYVTVYVTDITELKMTEKRLTESNKAKNQLFSIISHDLRSPLILLSNVLKLAEMHEFTKDDFQKFTSQVQQKLKIVFNTMDNVLSWARSQMDQITTYPENVSLNEIIAENMMLYNQLAEQKNLEMIFEPTKDYQIYADKNHISLIFRNLIHNSLKFTRYGGIYFKVEENEDSILIEMKDTGIGIEEPLIKKLLRQSNNESHEGTDGEMGTGLGMSVSLGLLKMNNGKISINSEKGKGTIFSISLPVSTVVRNTEVLTS